MTSHEYARELQKTAAILLNRPEIAFPHGPYLYESYYDKEQFLEAVRAMGSGAKKFTEHDFRFTPTDTCITMCISRSKVCRKVQEEKWECEPLLSEEEVSEIGA